MDVCLTGVANQSVFAELVGISQPAVAKLVHKKVLVSGMTYGQWLLNYTERLRTEAAGRSANEARERRDYAIARQAEAKAAIDERELYRQDQLILDVETVQTAMSEWITLAKTEFNNAVDRLITVIESENGITVDREQLQPDIDVALRAIGDYRYQSAEADS